LFLGFYPHPDPLPGREREELHGRLTTCMRIGKDLPVVLVEQVVAADSVWDVRQRLQENFRRVESLLREMEDAEDSKMRLAAAAEIRQHIALAERTLATATRAEAVRAFEEVVLEALAQANARVRRKVIEVLNARAGRSEEEWLEAQRYRGAEG